VRPPLQSRGLPDGNPIIRRKKQSPSDLRREARRNAQRLRAAARERGEAWADEIAHPNVTHKATQTLADLHAEKRDLRRDVYRSAPELEGADVRRATSRTLAG
jgi:F0F1-type ATP synthase membrane subunit b/b'